MIPLLFASYVYLETTSKGQSFFTLIEQDPLITILFIIAMTHPFCGLVLHFLIKGQKNNKHAEFNGNALFIVAAAELIMGNIIVFFMLLLFLFTNKQKLTWRQKNGLKETMLASTILGFSIIYLSLFVKILH